MSATPKTKGLTKSQQKTANKSRTAATPRPLASSQQHTQAHSLFSPNGDWFAHLSLAVDKHRLRIYDASSSIAGGGKCVLENVWDDARVCTVHWAMVDASSLASSTAARGKRKRQKVEEDSQSTSHKVPVLFAGLSNGSIDILSPSHSSQSNPIVRTLQHSGSTAPLIALALSSSGQTDSESQTLWTSSKDGHVRVWSLPEGELLKSWKLAEEHTAYGALLVRTSSLVDASSASDDEDSNIEGGLQKMDLIASNHQIHLFAGLSLSTSKQPKPTKTFTGHASPILSLTWLTSQSTYFASLADGDRSISVWSADGDTSDTIANLTLDSNARSLVASFLPTGKEKKKKDKGSTSPVLFALAASGKLCVLPYASSFSSTRNESLVPRSTISPPLSTSPIIAMSSTLSGHGKVRFVRLQGGIRPIFSEEEFITGGDWIQNVVIDDIDSFGLSATEGVQALGGKRYKESTLSSSGVTTGADLGDGGVDAHEGAEGDLDVEMAEASLGERLAAIDAAAAVGGSSASDSDDASDGRPKKEKHKTRSKKTKLGPGAAATSLTQSLIQALHSQDSVMLENVLSQSGRNREIIVNTLLALPPQLSVVLLSACVDRLSSTSSASGAGKHEKGGGASSQRATSLLLWIKCTLSIHTAYLMTLPDIVARLAGLHAALSRRMKLRDGLEGLSGRLEVLIGGVEMRERSRRLGTVVPLNGIKEKQKMKKDSGIAVARYVESDDDAQPAEDVESGEEEGSIEDIELSVGRESGSSSGSDSGSSSESGSDEDDGDEEEDEDESDFEGVEMNGFLDDEASESESGSGEESGEESD